MYTDLKLSYTHLIFCASAAICMLKSIIPILIDIGDCEEETWGDMPSPKSSTKSPVLVKTLEPNPSYGVLPESPCPVRKSVVDETDQVVYDNDQIPEYDDTEVYVNDQPPGTEEELYANDQPDEFEEYEYIQVKPSSRASPEMSEYDEYY